PAGRESSPSGRRSSGGETSATTSPQMPPPGRGRPQSTRRPSLARTAAIRAVGRVGSLPVMRSLPSVRRRVRASLSSLRPARTGSPYPQRGLDDGHDCVGGGETGLPSAGRVSPPFRRLARLVERFHVQVAEGTEHREVARLVAATATAIDDV